MLLLSECIVTFLRFFSPHLIFTACVFVCIQALAACALDTGNGTLRHSWASGASSQFSSCRRASLSQDLPSLLDRVSPCSPGWPQTPGHPPAFAFQVLGSYVWPPYWLGGDYISFLLQGWSRRAQKAIVPASSHSSPFPVCTYRRRHGGLAKREQGRRQGNYVPGSAARPTLTPG